MFVRMLQLPERATRPLRPVEPALRRARRRTVSGDVKRRCSSGGDRSSTSTTPAPRTSGRRGSPPPNGWRIPAPSVGRSSPAHVVGPDGEELGPGQEGVVYFEGGRPFEYHNDPWPTASMPNARGWRTLGDVGLLDEDGYLYLTDRAAHMIISGGVNIYPQEAENVLASDPRVADVAVIGVPDPEMGEAVKAVVELIDAVEGRPRYRSRTDRLLSGAAGRLQVSPHRRLRHRATPRPQRQALQAAAQRAVLGGPRHPRGVNGPLAKVPG